MLYRDGQSIQEFKPAVGRVEAETVVCLWTREVATGKTPVRRRWNSSSRRESTQAHPVKPGGWTTARKFACYETASKPSGSRSVHCARCQADGMRGRLSMSVREDKEKAKGRSRRSGTASDGGMSRVIDIYDPENRASPRNDGGAGVGVGLVRRDVGLGGAMAHSNPASRNRQTFIGSRGGKGKAGTSRAGGAAGYVWGGSEAVGHVKKAVKTTSAGKGRRRSTKSGARGQARDAPAAPAPSRRLDDTGSIPGSSTARQDLRGGMPTAPAHPRRTTRRGGGETDE